VVNVVPDQVLVDYSLIRKAPPVLNRAGVADVVSIASALGDWRIAHEHFGEKFDRTVHDEARTIADTLMANAEDIRSVSDAGIRALVQGQADEVRLCEKWGNAQPEEGGEHLLAYCLEALTHAHYIHGNLVALNIIVVLRLQRETAAYDWSQVKDFLDRAGVAYRPKAQGIRPEDFRRALESVGAYVRSEQLLPCLWSLEKVFDSHGEYSVNGILDWVFSWE
jgi:glycerol dehydrogenase-like iron-containing ADH family enzyme